MQRRLFFLVVVLSVCFVGMWKSNACATEIISETQAARHGLTRCWWTQVQMAPGRDRLLKLVLYEGILYAQTDQAMIHAIDAETGATLWVKQIGRASHPDMTPGLGRGLLAVINGSRLYVVNRLNGKVLYEQDIDGAPSAGPAVSNTRVYVPTVTGRLLGYKVQEEISRDEENATGESSGSELIVEQKSAGQEIHIKQEKIPPTFCQSKGRIFAQPLITLQNADEEFIVWPTDAGYLYMARVDCGADYKIDIRFRLQTNAPITARPTYLPPDRKIVGDLGVVFAASGDGYVHAILQRTGEEIWRFSTGEPLIQPAVVIQRRIFAAGLAFFGALLVILEGG
ncbi:MAG: outer membrane protein assembly factor BamB family protein [Thermoguttaceae bacterium]